MSRSCAIETELNKTYNDVGIKWAVQVAEAWNDNSWDLDHNDSLSVTGSSAWSVYTPEMKALNEAYKASHSLVSGAAYLFALPQAAPTEDGKTVYGDMPRGKRYGYLFNGSNGRTAAHEMGHGMFSLKHTFDNGYGFGMNAMGDNVMSYGDGINLSKLQWDAIHAPGLVIGVFEGDEDGAYAEQNYIVIEKDRIFLSPAGNPVFLPKGSRVYHICLEPTQYPNWALTSFSVYDAQNKKYTPVIASSDYFSTFPKRFAGYGTEDTKQYWLPQQKVTANASTTITLLYFDNAENKLKLYETQNYKFEADVLTIKNGQLINILYPDEYTYNGTAIEVSNTMKGCGDEKDNSKEPADVAPETINDPNGKYKAIVKKDKGEWKVVVTLLPAAQKNAKIPASQKEAIEQEMSREASEKLNELNGLNGKKSKKVNQATEDGGDFYVKDMNGREWMNTICDLGSEVWENAALPQDYWNKDKEYNKSTIHVPPTFAGVGDGVIEEVTDVPQLVKLGYDVATKEEVRQGLWKSVKNISVASIKKAAVNFYEEKKANYTSDKSYIVSHTVGKDGVQVASIIIGGGFLKKGADALEEGVEETGETIKKKVDDVDINDVEKFIPYTKNGFRIDATTLEDGFKHVDNITLNGAGKPSYGSGGLVGCHNEVNFNTQRISNGGRIEVISEVPSAVNGVKNVEYKVLQLDAQGNPIPGQYISNGAVYNKTLHDPNIIPESTLKNLGYNAFKDAIDNPGKINVNGPRTFEGSFEGRSISGYYKDVNGEKIISSWWIKN